jgi:SAM-dependent methyltransferase
MEGKVVESKMARDAENLRRQLGSASIRSIVDIGGGNLTRLVKLKQTFECGPPERPVEAVCLDFQFDPTVTEYARRAGIRLVTGNVETDVTALRDGGHDLVIMRQLIEHLRDPRAALLGLHRKLSPQGWLVIDTPNRGGFDYHLFRRRYWGGYHVPRHFHLFTRQSLVALATACGYRIVRNALGLNSIERGRSLWEFLNLKNLPVVGGFYVLDLICAKLGLPTSNQFIFLTPAPQQK